MFCDVLMFIILPAYRLMHDVSILAFLFVHTGLQESCLEHNFNCCCLFIKPRPHQQQCRSNIVECYKMNGFFDTVECCFDIVADVDGHDVITWPARMKPPAGPPWSVTDDDRRHTAKQCWSSTLCVGGPVIN